MEHITQNLKSSKTVKLYIGTFYVSVLGFALLFDQIKVTST